MSLSREVVIVLYRSILRQCKKYDSIDSQWKISFLAHRQSLWPYIQQYNNIKCNYNSPLSTTNPLLWFISDHSVLTVVRHHFKQNQHCTAQQQLILLQQGFDVLRILSEFSSIGTFDTKSQQVRNTIHSMEINERNNSNNNNKRQTFNSTSSELLDLPDSNYLSPNNSAVPQYSTGYTDRDELNDAQYANYFNQQVNNSDHNQLTTDLFNDIDDDDDYIDMLYDSMYSEDTVGKSYESKLDLSEEMELQSLTDHHNNYSNNHTSYSTQPHYHHQYQQQQSYGLLTANVSNHIKQRFLLLRSRLHNALDNEMVADKQPDQQYDVDNTVFQLLSSKYRDLLFDITPFEWSELMDYYENCIDYENADENDMYDEDEENQNLFDDIQFPPRSTSIHYVNAIDCYIAIKSINQSVPRTALRSLARIIESSGSSSDAMILLRESAFAELARNIYTHHNQSSDAAAPQRQSSNHWHANYQRYSLTNDINAYTAQQHISYLLASTSRWISAAQDARHNNKSSTNNSAHNNNYPHHPSQNTFNTVPDTLQQRLIDDQWLVESAIIACSFSDFDSISKTIDYATLSQLHRSEQSSTLISTQLYDTMIQHNITPIRMATYNSLAWMYGRLGMVKQVQQLIDTIHEQDRLPSRILYHSLLFGHCMQRDIDSVYHTLQSMDQSNIKPTQSALVITYMLACCTDERVERCSEIIDIASKYDIDVNSICIKLINELSVSSGSSTMKLSEQLFLQVFDSVIHSDYNSAHDDVDFELIEYPVDADDDEVD